MKKRIFFIFLSFILLIASKSNFTFCQTKSFDNPQYILAKEELKKYIIDIYKEDKKEFYEDATGREKGEIKSLLLDRKERTLELLDKDLLIITGPIYDYVNNVFKKILKFNPQIGLKKIIIVKTESVNAFTAGEGIIYVNLGLLYRLQSEEQLAYILCHEFSHDKLNHFEKNVREYVSERTDKEKDKKIKEILKKQYNHVTNLNKLLIPDLIADSKRRRSCEFAADSLGMKFYIKSGYNPSYIKSAFDVLSSSEHEVDTLDFDFKTQLKLNEKIIDLKKLSVEKYESSLGSFDESLDETAKEKAAKKKELHDLLRSHPFEKDRIAKIHADNNVTNPLELKNTLPNFRETKLLFQKELINYFLQTDQLGRSIFTNLIIDKEYESDPYFLEAKIVAFLELQYCKLHMKAGVVLEDLSEYHDENYNSLLTFLGKLSPAECNNIARNYYAQLPESTTLNNKMIRLLLSYYDKKNNEFKNIYEMNKELFINSIYADFTRQLYDEVKKRI